MSNRPHRRRRRRLSVDRAFVEKMAHRAASFAGCWCQPEVTVRHEHDAQVITVCHDNDCPAATAPSMFAVGPRRGR